MLVCAPADCCPRGYPALYYVHSCRRLLRRVVLCSTVFFLSPTPPPSPPLRVACSRPDYCLGPHLREMLAYGCTRLEIGVQSM